MARFFLLAAGGETLQIGIFASRIRAGNYKFSRDRGISVRDAELASAPSGTRMVTQTLYGQLRRWFGVIRTGCTVIKSNGRIGEQVGQSRKT